MFKKIICVFVSFTLFISLDVLAVDEPTPRFYVDFNMGKELNLTAGSTTSFNFDIGNLDLDRKILSDIAVSDSTVFEKIVKTATS